MCGSHTGVSDWEEEREAGNSKAPHAVNSVGDAICRSKGIFSGFSSRRAPLGLAAVEGEGTTSSARCERGVGAVADLSATSLLQRAEGKRIYYFCHRNHRLLNACTCYV